MATNNNIQPVTPAVFHILLALSSGERHGYGIMKQVEADSQGKVSMGPGTLYGSLKRMLDAGLVRERATSALTLKWMTSVESTIRSRGLARKRLRPSWSAISVLSASRTSGNSSRKLLPYEV